MGLWLLASLCRVLAGLPLFDHERYVELRQRIECQRHLLTFVRLRWVSHGIHQRCTKLHGILQSPTRRQQRHRDRLRYISDRPDGRSVVQLGLGLARPSLANIYWMFGDLHRCDRDSSCSDHPCVHRRALHVVVLFDDCNSCGSNVPYRDCTAAASWDCGWFVQYIVLSGKYS
jgi:hypothetical protein